MKLAQHSYSGIFGDFLFNSIKDASAHSILQQSSDDDLGVENLNAVSLFSVWDYLRKDNLKFVNPAFNTKRKRRLGIPKALWEISLWREVYCCTDVEAIVNNPVSPLDIRASLTNEPFTGRRTLHNRHERCWTC